MDMNGKVEKPKIKYYQVKAKDYDGARAFFDKRTADGCFTAIFDYQEEASSAMAKGKYDGITFIAKSEIVLPQWRGASKLTGQEAKNWRSLIAALKKHEIAHFEMFKLDIIEMVRELEKVSEMTKPEIKKAMDKFLKAAQGNQNKFDKARKHGAKDGVCLPPIR